MPKVRLDYLLVKTIMNIISDITISSLYREFLVFSLAVILNLIAVFSGQQV